MCLNWTNEYVGNSFLSSNKLGHVSSLSPHEAIMQFFEYLGIMSTIPMTGRNEYFTSQQGLLRGVSFDLTVRRCITENNPDKNRIKKGERSECTHR